MCLQVQLSRIAKERAGEQAFITGEVEHEEEEEEEEEGMDFSAFSGSATQIL